MSWLQKYAKSDVDRIRSNIKKLESLCSRVRDLGYFATASNSGGYHTLKKMLTEKTVLGRPKVHAKLQEALVGENNQKVALDSPARFQGIMVEAEKLIQMEIGLEQRALKELKDE